MRKLSRTIAAAAAFLGLVAIAACDPGAANAPRGGFTLEILASDSEQIYLVSHSDGREAAARAENGVSALMDADRARVLAAERASAMREPEKADVSIRAPGFSLQVAEDNEGQADERARIEINAGGQHVLVDAEGEEDSGKALVRISGANEEAARDFINDADGLSAETKAQMLQALRL